ncbi:unnamed protein product [Mytilus coruscus]|uniref:Uncharacterized protein n=1 Tax=Mytilus coruscus TaxID=42192 RepID=A0A6J8D363_MYTCO|nr:unnamed protein product [Mytilus coruscus]
MREDINNIKNEIVKMTTINSNINDIWIVFKTSLEKSVNLNIPHKQARTKDSPPWISRDLKRLIRKRDRLYKKNKKSHDKKDSEKYKTIKRQTEAILFVNHEECSATICFVYKHSKQFGKELVLPSFIGKKVNVPELYREGIEEFAFNKHFIPFKLRSSTPFILTKNKLTA